MSLYNCFLCSDRGIVIIKEFDHKAVKWNKKIGGFPRKRYKDNGKSYEYFNPKTNEILNENEVEEYDYFYSKAYKCICDKGKNYQCCKSIKTMPFYKDIENENKNNYKKVGLRGKNDENSK